MSIDETAIRQWADRHLCRSKLPLLVRRLIRETTPTLSSLRFPGNEAVDLAGIDGQVETDDGNIWVPKGRSVWEMGCDQNPRAKAHKDYLKRTIETSQEERENCSFVFITPRRWNTKGDWLQERNDEGSWAGVHAYDAIDIETWLEDAPVTLCWLSELLNIAIPGVLTPDEWWQRWATVSDPPLSKRLVATRRHNEANILVDKLRDSEHVVPVQADDRGEATAFVIAALAEADATDLLDRTLVVTSSDARIPASATRLIVIADVPNGEDPDFGDRRNVSIVRPYPKGRLDIHKGIKLSHVPSDVFRSELVGLGLPKDKADSLALTTGHSVPVLRRNLSLDPEIRRPIWARDRASAERLLPFALAGSWMERGSVDDVAVLQLLGELNDGEVERIRDDLLSLDDAPIATYGNVNIVVSQLDALFAVGPFIERDDLERFYQLVPELLSDRDPALDLPKDQWWMANVLGKARNYSGGLLSGLGDALCILTVYGAEICGHRLQVNCALRAEQLVQSLMDNADEERWLTIRDHLRVLAEASPNAFIESMEKELRKPEPAIRAIMGTTGGAVGGDCLRTNLLWALESLAWFSAHFSRVAQIIFDLRRIEVDDNWSNSPKSTARSLFLAWLPATSVSVAERMAVLRKLSVCSRNTTIDVCITLLPGGGPGFASRTSMPHWRELAQEVPTPTNGDVRYAAMEASCLLMDMAPFVASELEKLLEVLTRLRSDDLNRLVVEVVRWSANANDDEKAELRLCLHRRQLVYTYQKAKDNKEGLDVVLQKLATVLEPETAIARYRWLFESSHIEWPALVEHKDGGRLSWKEREIHVQEKRREALAEIEQQIGHDQILSFAFSVKHPELVAQVLVLPTTSAEVAAKWISRVLEQQRSEAADTFLRQLLWSAGLYDLPAVVVKMQENGELDDQDKQKRLAEHFPGSASGWSVADAIGGEFAKTYWGNVTTRIWDDTSLDAIEYAIEKLMDARRPRSAFSAVAHWSERVTPELWARILQAITDGDEPDGPLPSSYDLDEVFKCLDHADGFTDEQIAVLEFPFVQILCSHGYRDHERTLAIHRELARDPQSFVQLLFWNYRRKDGVVDPGEEDLSNDYKESRATLAYHALEGWKTVPGRKDDGGEVDQEKFALWVEDSLDRAAAVDRREPAEKHIAKLLSEYARRQSWENWLPECMLELLDKPENDGLREKFDTGVYNSRGFTTRGPYDGGDQERRLAGHYRNLAARYGNSYPRVSAMLITISEDYECYARREDEQAVVIERWRP